MSFDSQLQGTGQNSPSTARFVHIAILTVFLSPLWFCVGVLCAFFLSEPLARSMMPPIYPNSQLIGTDTATGSWGYTQFYRYSTSDSMATADSWYSNNASYL